MENGTIVNGLIILGKTGEGLLICQNIKGELILVNPETLKAAA